MRILVAGVWRSGTTAVFNLVRVICQEHGKVYSCFADDYDKEKGSSFDYEIVKVHKFKEKWLEWPDIVFTTFREPQDVLRSMQNFGDSGGRVLNHNDALRGFAWLALYNQKVDLIVHYNQIARKSPGMIKNIASEIGLKVNTRAVVQKWIDIKPPKEGFDPITQLYSNHISDEK